MQPAEQISWKSCITLRGFINLEEQRVCTKYDVYVIATDSNAEESIELEEMQVMVPFATSAAAAESGAEASGTEDESKPLDGSSHPPKPRGAPGRYPWHALVSYVDELTVGGKRDSKGRYTDGLGKFPGFGRNNKEKVPQTCFPHHWYERWVLGRTASSNVLSYVISKALVTWHHVTPFWLFNKILHAYPVLRDI